MNIIVRWSLFGLIVFVICMALTVPAKQGLAWLQLSDEVNVQGVSGRLLDGQAQQLIINNISINQFDWSWQPLALLLGHLSLDWIANDPDMTGKGNAVFPLVGQNEISNAKASLSLAKIQALLPIGTTLTGQADIVLQQLLFEQTITVIDASLEGHDVEVVTAFGKLNLPILYLHATGTLTEGFELTLEDAQKNTTVNLIAKYLNGQIALSGEIKVASNIAKQLSDILPVIAKKQGEKWLVDWNYKG